MLKIPVYFSTDQIQEKPKIIITKVYHKAWSDTNGRFVIKDGLIDVNGDVNITFYRIKKTPFAFGIVTGDLLIVLIKLMTLRGCPTIGGSFNCYGNNLESQMVVPKK
jgi:hypothetical protein